jgi:nucleoid-associated protein EbfC
MMNDHDPNEGAPEQAGSPTGGLDPTSLGLPGAEGAAGLEGGFDVGALLGQAMEMQQQLLEAQSRAAATEVEGVAGGGLVRITLTGELEARRVHIDPSAVDPDDVELLADLVLAALRDAFVRVDELRNEALGGSMPDPSALLGQLGGLGGLTAGVGDELPGGVFDALGDVADQHDDER